MCAASRIGSVFSPDNAQRRPYPSSLLYLVSGLFEDGEGWDEADAPLLGMERFLEGPTGWDADPVQGPAIIAVREWLAAGADRIVLAKAAGGPGLNSGATSHGGFDDDRETLESVATFLA